MDNQPIGHALPQWKPPTAPVRETLRGIHCALHPADPVTHAAALFAANAKANDSLWTYLSYGPFETLAAYQSWMTSTCLGNDPLFFTIIPTAASPAGLISYLRIDRPNGVLEIGHLCFFPALQKTPAATEAIYLLIAHAFHIGYRRVEWKCDSLNAPSKTAALRYGFTFEGIFRQAVVYKKRNRDTAWFAIIDQDWPRLNAAFQTWLAPANFTADGQQRTRLSSLTAACPST